MSIFLRQSTASQEIPLGYFVDSTDGNTEETGLTIANTDIKLWKTGATTLANKNSGGATHISNGLYYCVLDATDTGTLGPMVVYVHVSGALAVRVETCVLDAVVYDSLIAASDKLQVDTRELSGTSCTARDIGASVLLSSGTGTGQVTLTSGRVNADLTHISAAAVSTSTAQLGVNVVNAAGTAWGSGAITAASIASNAITSAKIATDAIGAAQLATDAVTEIVTGVWNAATASYGTAGSYGLLIETNLDATVSSRLASASYTAPLDAAGTRTAVGLASANLDTQLSTIDTVVDSILVDTAEIGAAGAGLTALATQASVNTVDTVVDAIKVKTDSLTFTQAGQVDANIKRVADTTVAGTGTAGDPWGP